MQRWTENLTRRTVLGGMAALAASPQARAATSLRVGLSQPIFSFTPLDLGIELGLFEKSGLTIEKTTFAGSAKLHQAIAAGSIDIGLGAGPELGFLAKGAPEMAVAALADLPKELAITVLKDGPVKTVADLKGRRVSVSTKGSLTEWGGQELSRQQGWGPTGINLLPLGSFGAQIAALKTHQIDGMVVEASTSGRMEEEGIGVTLVNFEHLVPKFHIHVMYAANSLIAGQPEALRAFIAGWFASIAAMKADRARAVAVVVKVLDVTPSLAGKLYDDIMPMYNPTGHFDPDALKAIAKAEMQMGDTEGTVDFSKYVTEAFLPKT